ncbi:MAG: GIY-YIG nuclease family protein [Nitrospira sp.]|nr:GIY-YIG nuclease family protein [Nitrospira sp.]
MKRFPKIRMPHPSQPDYKIVMAALNRQAEMDVGFRLKMDEINEKLPHFALTRSQGGSGFIVAETLRGYFIEYLNRLTLHGQFSLPTSFNVVQSFLSYSKSLLAFDLREEREHLLRFYEYFDWYTANSFPDQPLALTDILPEGIVYAYNGISPLDDFVLETDNSKLRILGVGMVRHGHDLSAIIIAGENPPFPSDEDIRKELKIPDSSPYPGKEGLRSEPSLNTKDRYVSELPGHSRVIMLARYDLQDSTFDVRYVNLDVGAGYMVLTDDRTIYHNENDRDEMLPFSIENLPRYSSLFSALASLLYLPAFFVDHGARIVETKFATDLHTKSRRTLVNKAIKTLGLNQVPFFRTMRCLSGIYPDRSKAVLTIDPPAMDFESSGYWRPLPNGEVGQTKDGTPIVGQTWVKRTETWKAQSLSSFVISRTPCLSSGEDPGWIYIMRSGSHHDDIYKIGLTRRTTEERAKELSGSTGVPTGFEVLFSWVVGDCAKFEQELHRRLKHLRINRQREFFRGNLQEIVKAVSEMVPP